MRIVIVGAGLVGSSLAEQLLYEGHDISIVEVRPEFCQAIEEKLDVLVVEGSGSNPQILIRARIKEAEILLAVTPEDEINIIACGIGKQLGVREKIARIRNHDYVSSPETFSLQAIGVDRIIEPEKAVVESIYQYILTPGAIEATSFENGLILLREYKVSNVMPIAGKTLMQARKMAEPSEILIMTIVRDDRAIIPSGDIVVQDNDEILALFPASSLEAFLNLLAIPSKKVRKIVMTGDNLTSFKLAQRLDKHIDNVIWVSPDYEYGQWGASQLTQVEVLHGDCTEVDLLKEIHVENADFFIGSGKNTENNIMSALLAKSQGVRETIAISNQPAKSNKLFKSIGVDHVINPRLTTADSILDLIHRGGKLKEIKIRDMDLEAIRIIAGENSKICGIPLHKAWKPLAQKAIIGAIIRNENLMIPSGDFVIHPGDQAMVIARVKTLGAIKNLFKERL
ncbi:Trk system potassium transporter TrkA [bacterium]|nr:Trk system potassium transporter TrkA [candidate division CSSED10-310 bacterium]